jgi:ATP-dependent helicase/nuclease subunit B
VAIRFIIGRAGSGKTRYCLDAIREALVTSPVDGPRLLLLVPEQAALQMERSIINAEGIACSHRAEVLSFRRLAHRVLESRPAIKRRALSETARAMILRHIVSTGEVSLNYYRQTGRLGGFIDEIGRAISELIQESITPAELRDCASDAPDDAQASKFADIAAVYAAYLDRLSDSILDPTQFLAIAREHLAHTTWIAGAHVWIDGFASLTREELLTVVALSQSCAQMEITILMDPSSASDEAGTADADAGIFLKTMRTYRDLHRALSSNGHAIDDPLLLQPAVLPRFADNEALAQVESHFGSSAIGGESGKTRGKIQDSHTVRVAELPSKRLEVEFAVATILNWVTRRENPMRYRDIAIIARDLDTYHDLIADALDARAIPFFIDQRRSVAHHALPELIRAMIALPLRDFGLDDMRLALKTGLWPVEQERIDELENYLLAHGLSGLGRWTSPFHKPARKAIGEADQQPDAYEATMLERLNQTRAAIVALLEDWIAFSRGEGARTGGDWARAFLNLTEKLGCLTRLQAWITDAEREGRLDEAAEHRRVFHECDAFLRDLTFALGDEPLSLAELADVIDTGLASISLGVAPPMVDQILVGSIERSRHPDIKAAIIIGFTDGVYPQYPAEASIINDDDRILMVNRGLSPAPDSTTRILDEPLLTYIALTRSSRELLITFPAVNDEGKPIPQSPELTRLSACLPGTKSEPWADPESSRALWSIHTVGDLSSHLAREMRSRPALVDDESRVRGQWNSLYQAARAARLSDQQSQRVLSSLLPPRSAGLSPETMESLWDSPFVTSVSGLEAFTVCPFKFFADSVLRLQTRDGALLTPMDVGRVHHKILEEFVLDIARKHQRLSDYKETALLDELRGHCTRVTEQMTDSRSRHPARDRYMLRRADADLARVLRAQRQLANLGKACPESAELAFGMGERGLDALQIRTPGGRVANLRGFIDRVDVAEVDNQAYGIVIDYKHTPNKSLKLDSVLHGLSLQLLAYLLVLEEHGRSRSGLPITPLASLYVSLRTRRKRVDHPDEAGPSDETIPNALKPRGVISVDRLDALESLSKGWAEGYAIFIKEGNELGYVDSSDGLERAQFRTVLDYTRQTLGEIVDEILDGRIAVNPYRQGSGSPCSWCGFASFCRFEIREDSYRKLPNIKRSDVLAIMADRTSRKP